MKIFKAIYDFFNKQSNENIELVIKLNNMWNNSCGSDWR